MDDEKFRAAHDLSEVRNVLNDFSTIYRGFVKAKRIIMQTGYRKGMGNLSDFEKEFDEAAKIYGIILKETIRISKEIGGPMMDFRMGSRVVMKNDPNSPYSLVMDTERKLKRFDQKGLLKAFRKDGKGFLHDYLATNFPDDLAGLNAYVEGAEESVQKTERMMDELKETLEV